MLIYLTRKERFNAAHRMYREEWSAEENLKVFGKCANPNWHGHNYTLVITVKGQINYETGYLMDLKELKTIVNEQVIEKLDHKNLNLDVDFLKGKMATTEILCIEIFKQLQGPIEQYDGVYLHSVKLHETENNSAEYFGESSLPEARVSKTLHLSEDFSRSSYEDDNDDDSGFCCPCCLPR